MKRAAFLGGRHQSASGWWLKCPDCPQEFFTTDDKASVELAYETHVLARHAQEE